MFDPVCAGRIDYAWSVSKFTSTISEFKDKHVVVDGMSRFELERGLIKDYREIVNGGVAMVQWGMAPGRMEKVLLRWAEHLKDCVEVAAHCAGGRRV